MKLKSILKESPNDQMMYKEEMKDVVSSIMIVWDRAQHLGISYESFIKDLEQQVAGATQDLADRNHPDGVRDDPRNKEELSYGSIKRLKI